MIVEEGVWKGHRYWIRANKILGFYCGYAESKKKIDLNNEDEYLEYWMDRIRVHGGVTYAADHLADRKYNYLSKGTIIGFDCNHGNDACDKELLSNEGIRLWNCQSPSWYEMNAKKERWDLSKVKLECFKMIDQIIELEKERKNNES